jgi:DNA-3-methyladenine glycosylase II
MPQAETIQATGPYDLKLTLEAAAHYDPDPHDEASVFRAAVRVGGAPVLMEVLQVQQAPTVLEVTGPSAELARRLSDIAAWMLWAELDLGPFYAQASGHPLMASIVKRLHGLKPIRPESLFQMAVIAVTEQQISMMAALSIRARLIERFGDPVEDLWAFPTPGSLAMATPAELMDCGLSRRKSDYIHDLAGRVVAGDVDLERLRELPDDEVRAIVTDLRGFGPWSADYILVRGLGRPDSLPADDLGVRTVVGAYLGDGERMRADEVRHVLAPFAPYRGLAAYYLLVHAGLGGRPPIAG